MAAGQADRQGSDPDRDRSQCRRCLAAWWVFFALALSVAVSVGDGALGTRQADSTVDLPQTREPSEPQQPPHQQQT